VKSKLFLLILLSPFGSVFACGDIQVTYQASVSLVDGRSHLELLVPRETEALHHPMGSFSAGGISVPMYGGYEENDWIYFEPSIPEVLVDEARVKIVYTYKPTTSGQDSGSVLLCAEQTIIDWKDVPSK